MSKKDSYGQPHVSCLTFIDFETHNSPTSISKKIDGEEFVIPYYIYYFGIPMSFIYKYGEAIAKKIDVVNTLVPNLCIKNGIDPQDLKGVKPCIIESGVSYVNIKEQSYARIIGSSTGLQPVILDLTENHKGEIGLNVNLKQVIYPGQPVIPIIEPWVSNKGNTPKAGFTVCAIINLINTDTMPGKLTRSSLDINLSMGENDSYDRLKQIVSAIESEDRRKNIIPEDAESSFEEEKVDYGDI